jgi:hypothetical protein
MWTEATLLMLMLISSLLNHERLWRDRPVRHLNDGAKQMIAAGPAARLESFRCHASFWFRNAA